MKRIKHDLDSLKNTLDSLCEEVHNLEETLTIVARDKGETLTQPGYYDLLMRLRSEDFIKC